MQRFQQLAKEVLQLFQRQKTETEQESPLQEQQTTQLNSLFKQKLALAVGRYGCYFSCLIKIAEEMTQKNIDIIEAFDSCKRQTSNSTPWITDDCFCNYPDRILSYYTGKKAEIVKTEQLDTDLSGYDFVIGCYKWESSHFVLIDKESKAVIYDPLESSNTVKNGTLVSYRAVKIES